MMAFGRGSPGLSGDGMGLAVPIKQLVQADISAVVFSANPVTGSRDYILINASWGLGESIVNGVVTPDAYVVRKADLECSIGGSEPSAEQGPRVAAGHPCSSGVHPKYPHGHRHAEWPLNC